MANDQVVRPPSIHDANYPAYVQDVLQQHFGGPVNVGRDTGEERVSGYLVSEQFDNLEQIQRQRLVRETLQQELGPEVQGVSIILTYTPIEFELMGTR